MAANDDDLQKAYRKLAIKGQPDKKIKNKNHAKSKFKQISEANDALSDPQKRAVVYDKDGGRESSSGGPSGFSRKGMSADDNFSALRNAGYAAARERSAKARERSGNEPRKAPPIERILPCSLEDLYKGATKKMKISRDVIDSNGRTSVVEETITVEIKPGWKKGTKITFVGKGNEQRGLIPSDIVIIIDEMPHGDFRRIGNDLILTRKISLMEALTGFTAQVTALDGRNLTIPISTFISSAQVAILEGEGMTNPKEPSQKGNLKIVFIVEFPPKLSPEQIAGLKDLLASS